MSSGPRLPRALIPDIVTLIRQHADNGLNDTDTGRKITEDIGVRVTVDMVRQLRNRNDIPPGRSTGTKNERECPRCELLITVAAGRIEIHNGFLGAQSDSGIQLATPCPAGGTPYMRWFSEMTV